MAFKCIMQSEISQTNIMSSHLYTESKKQKQKPPNQPTNTENRQVVARGKGVRGGKTGEGNQKVPAI